MESSSTNTTATPISAGSLYSTAEWFAVGGSIGLVVLYFLVHAFVVFRLPLKTTLGINLAERKRWIKKMITTGNNQLVVVQTLRNNLMTSTYFATSASTVALYVITEALKRPYSVQQIQLLAISFIMMGAFLNFLTSIRALNNVGYIATHEAEDNGGITNQPLDSEDPQLTVKQKLEVACSLMTKGTLHYSYGVKFFFLIIPIGCWIFSPIGFLVGSVGVVAYFLWSDRAA